MSRSSDSSMSIPSKSCHSVICMVGNVRQWNIQGILYIFSDSGCEEAQFVPFRHPKVRVIKFDTAWLLTYCMLIQVIVGGVIPWSFSLDFSGFEWARKEKYQIPLNTCLKQIRGWLDIFWNDFQNHTWNHNNSKFLRHFTQGHKSDAPLHAACMLQVPLLGSMAPAWPAKRLYSASW